MLRRHGSSLFGIIGHVQERRVRVECRVSRVSGEWIGEMKIECDLRRQHGVVISIG
jgi:hypothetical protein